MQCHVCKDRETKQTDSVLGVESKPRGESRRALEHRSALCYLTLDPSLGLDKLTLVPISQGLEPGLAFQGR